MQPFALPLLGPDLARVEAALLASVQTEDPFLTDVASHLLKAGGKRLRPALALAAAYAVTGSASKEVVQGGVSVELVHLGSLYHDDVMDEADTRRGVVSANARWGNLVAILSGDFLLARASVLAAALGTEVAGLIGATIGRLCEGQVLELQTAFNPDRSEDAYVRSIRGKTASLMATATRVGAIVSGLDRGAVETLTAYGEAVGMTFQIADDILDLIATDEQLGKPAGNDVVEGTYTLPVIRALADPLVGEELRALLVPGLDRSAVDRIRKLVRASSGVEGAIVVGRCFADAAGQALSSLRCCAPSAGQSEVLSEMAAFPHRLLDGLPL